jgi:hypothetical protein
MKRLGTVSHMRCGAVDVTNCHTVLYALCTHPLFLNPFHDTPMSRNVRYNLHTFLLCRRRCQPLSYHRLIDYIHWRVATNDQKREQQPFSEGRCLRSRSLEGALLLVIISDIAGDTSLAYGGYPCQAI